MKAARAGADIGCRGPNRSEPGRPRLRQTPLPSPGSALVPALLMAVLGTPSLRVESIASNSSATAAAVLEHFVASQTKGARWPEETLKRSILADAEEDWLHERDLQALAGGTSRLCAWILRRHYFK